jgi:trk system potassium uptake protein
VNYGTIAKVIGSLLIFEAVMFLPAFLAGFYYNETSSIVFLAVMALTLAVGTVLRKMSSVSETIRAKEALIIVAGGWLAVSFFGALPFYFSGSIPSFMDAFFETVSGLTTTGATILVEIETLDRGILFWRSFTHWLGGMGILVLTLAVLPALGVGGFQIFKAETPGPVADKLAPKMKNTAAILYTAYFGITALETVLLMFGGLSLYDALVHTFGTVGTGGFSTLNNSIGGFSSAYVQWVIAIFMVASGVNFSLYYAAYRHRLREIADNEELKFYLVIISAATLLVFFNLQSVLHGSPFTTLRHAFFQVASIMTTTGYTTVNYELWPSFSQSILFFLMFVGGSAGSTGGSIKVIRLLVLVKLIRREITRILHPRALVPVRIHKRMLEPDVIASVTSFYILYLLIAAVGSILMTLEGLDILSAISSVAATLGNIGPGFGFVGPTQNYAAFSVPAKGLLSLLMLMGRLELFTVFILMTPEFWRESN